MTILVDLLISAEWLEFVSGGALYVFSKRFREYKRGQWLEKGQRAMIGDVVLWITTYSFIVLFTIIYFTEGTAVEAAI